jgi:hypothetical protein
MKVPSAVSPNDGIILWPTDEARPLDIGVAYRRQASKHGIDAERIRRNRQPDETQGLRPLKLGHRICGRNSLRKGK